MKEREFEFEFLGFKVGVFNCFVGREYFLEKFVIDVCII